jgi:hypothetical protein
MKKSRIVIAAIITSMIGLSLFGYAVPQKNFEAALVYLLNARASSSVSTKNDNLKKARDQIVAAKYPNGGYANEAITLILQAFSYIKENKIKNANTMIDGAMGKVQKAIKLIKQEAAAKAKQAQTQTQTAK